MQCPHCKSKNNTQSIYCQKCGWSFVTESYDRDYCSVCRTPLLHPENPCLNCMKSAGNKAGNLAGNINLNFECTLCGNNFRENLLLKNTLSIKEELLLETTKGSKFCPDCIEILKIRAYSKLDDYKKTFNKMLDEMPVITLAKPLNYTLVRYCDLIASQSILEKDLLQILSIKKYYEDDSFNNKFHQKQKECVYILKKNALMSGANAIIGVSLSFKEIKSFERSLLISATGTGAVVEEFNVLSDEELEVFRMISESL